VKLFAARRNVTIFGQSAGGASVCAAVASPTANGLFQRGISQSAFYNYKVNTIWSSGDCKSQLPTESEAQQAGATFAAKAGCGSAVDQAACLRALPVQTLIDIHREPDCRRHHWSDNQRHYPADVAGQGVRHWTNQQSRPDDRRGPRRVQWRAD
jgi:carboxylesterase type B